jgi:hypothetical protein
MSILKINDEFLRFSDLQLSIMCREREVSENIIFHFISYFSLDRSESS